MVLVVESVEENGEVDASRLQAQCWMKTNFKYGAAGMLFTSPQVLLLFRWLFHGWHVRVNTSYPAVDDQAVRSTDVPVLDAIPDLILLLEFIVVGFIFRGGFGKCLSRHLARQLFVCWQ